MALQTSSDDRTNGLTGDADRAFGNAEGWLDFKFKDAERGIATHVYAAFEPALAGKSPAPDYTSHRVTAVLIATNQVITERIYWTAM
jgi:hypothetical protein